MSNCSSTLCSVIKVVRLFLFLTLLVVTCCNQQQDASSNHQDVPLRVSVCNQYPFHYVTKMQDGTVVFNGTGFHIFSWIAKKLNRFLVPVAPSDEDLEKYGYVKACTNLVYKGEADVTVIGGHAVTPDQLEFIDLSHPISLSPLRMIVSAGVEEERLFAFTRPFDSMVWTLFFITLFCIIITASVISFLYAKMRGSSSRTAPSFISLINKFGIHTMSIINAHTHRNPFDHDGLRLLGSFWLLGISIIVYHYSPHLISSLTVPTWTKPIETLQDVAASDSTVLYIDPNGPDGFGKAVMEAKYGILKTLGDQLRKHPDGLYNKVSTDEDFFVFHENYATPNFDYYAAWTIRRLYKKEKRCRFHLTAPLPFYSGLYYPMRKGHKDNQPINKAIMEMWAFGLIDHWLNEACFVPNAERCFTPQRDETLKKAVPIKILDLKSAFLIYSMGIGLAFLVFLLELTVDKYHKRIEMTALSAISLANNLPSTTEAIETVAVNNTRSTATSIEIAVVVVIENMISKPTDLQQTEAVTNNINPINTKDDQNSSSSNPLLEEMSSAVNDADASSTKDQTPLILKEGESHESTNNEHLELIDLE